MKELHSILISKNEYFSCEFLVVADEHESIKRRIEWVAKTRQVDIYLGQLTKNKKIIELLFSNIETGYFLVRNEYLNQYRLTIYEKDS